MTSDEAYQLYVAVTMRIAPGNCIWQRVIHHPGEYEWADTNYPLHNPHKREANMWFSTADTSAHDMGHYRAYWTVTMRGMNRVKICWAGRAIRIDGQDGQGGQYSCLADDETLVEARLLDII